MAPSRQEGLLLILGQIKKAELSDRKKNQSENSAFGFAALARTTCLADKTNHPVRRLKCTTTMPFIKSMNSNINWSRRFLKSPPQTRQISI